MHLEKCILCISFRMEINFLFFFRFYIWQIFWCESNRIPNAENITWFLIIATMLLLLSCRLILLRQAEIYQKVCDWFIHSFVLFHVTHAAWLSLLLSSSSSLWSVLLLLLVYIHNTYHVLRDSAWLYSRWTRIQNERKQIKKEIEQNRIQKWNEMKHEKK